MPIALNVVKETVAVERVKEVTFLATGNGREGFKTSVLAEDWQGDFTVVDGDHLRYLFLNRASTVALRDALNLVLGEGE